LAQPLGSKRKDGITKTRNYIRAVSAFEACEGLLALGAASGFLLLLHSDLQDIALRLVEHAHLNPAAHYPSIFILAADHMENANLALLALGAVAYSAFRFAEAFGLYREAPWAEVLAAASSTIYVPIEIIELVRRISLISAGVLVINMAVVGITVLALVRQMKGKPRTGT
jgi:uncharacterized membrane protein (DUF2068 family)